MEALRVALDVDRWLLYGRSWGAALALAYAEDYPERVTAMVLSAVFAGGSSELDWLYRGGAAGLFPDAWSRFAGRIAESDRMTLTWAGPQAAGQETGPFRTSPGAGAKGLNCDIAATSRRSGTKCTPKGTHTVEGFQRRLNSDARATFVTWFVQWRGIALHYFPSVPKYAASHGCVRITMATARWLPSVVPNGASVWIH